MSGIGVVAALPAEARALGRHHGALLAVSGMGWAAAATAASALVAARASALMTFGMAGGLDPKLPAGTLLLPSELISRDGVRLATCVQWRTRVGAAVSASRRTVDCILLTSTHAIETPADKAAAFRDTGAGAVDMESAAVAEVAARHTLPFIAVRAIVDTATDRVPSSVVAASKSGRVEIGRLIAGLIVAPGEIAALLRLASRYRAAMSSLRAAARHIE